MADKWRPGLPVLTEADRIDWRAWKKSSVRGAQRDRRARLRRIDYYPSPKAAAIIDARLFPAVGGDYNSVINRMIEAAAKIPE